MIDVGYVMLYLKGLLSRILCFLLGHRWDRTFIGSKKHCSRCGFCSDPCKWHENEKGYENGLFCCELCSCSLEAVQCDGCARWFLDWDAEGSGDGIIGRPWVNSSGDLVCFDCGLKEDIREDNGRDD